MAASESTTPDPKTPAVPPSRAARLQRYQARRRSQILRARRDPAFFVEFAIPHEKTGRPIHNEPFHEAWHEFFSATRWGVIEAAVELGKSIQIGLGRVLWEIGTNPNLRVLLVGANDDAARKLLGGVRRHIEQNPRVREVFPALRPSARQGDPWSDSDIIVERDYLSRDPTIQARGAGSHNILGSRLDLVVIDDLLHLDNTRTRASRDKIESWFDDYVFTRLVDDYDAETFGRCFVIGNPWDADDLLQRLKGRDGWDSMTTAVVENPDDPPARWRPVWPRQWPLERVMDRRRGMTDSAFARKHLCRVLSDMARRFKKAWLDHMLRLGVGRSFLTTIPTLRGSPLQCFTGVDLGVGERDVDAVSCLFTIAVTPGDKRRVVVDIRSGHWTGPEILDEAEWVSTTFDSELIVESNAAQKYLAQFAAGRGLSVSTYFTSGSNKFHEEWGVESLAVEMKNGLWVAPSGPGGHDPPDEVVEWVRELLDFDPSAHTGDRVMASWFAREGARRFFAARVQPSDHLRR